MEQIKLPFKKHGKNKMKSLCKLCFLYDKSEPKVLLSKEIKLKDKTTVDKNQKRPQRRTGDLKPYQVLSLEKVEEYRLTREGSIKTCLGTKIFGRYMYDFKYT